jgi:hypothetical protein
MAAVRSAFTPHTGQVDSRASLSSTHWRSDMVRRAGRRLTRHRRSR